MGSDRNLNSYRLLWLSLLSARLKKINSKMKELEWSQHFVHYKSMGIFSRRLRAANSAVPGRNLPNFELIRDFMVVLKACKNEEDAIKNGLNIIHLFCRRSRAAYITPESVMKSGRNSNSSKLLQRTVVLITCKDHAEFQTHSRYYDCPHYLQK